ncbi:MAG: GAF domain-containing sensor histidine kinase [Chloroflexi bacterium]|nr:GAF domain-containing sensor histidine kinase [Chloroflexota bacterium]
MIQTEPFSDDPTALIQRYARALFRYERLMEISRKLSSTLDLSVLLEQIVFAAADLTNSEASSILLVDRRTGTLHFEAAMDPTGYTVYGIEVPLEGSIAGWVVTNNQPLVLDDAANDPRFYKGVDEQTQITTRELIAVPMSTRDRVIGCMEALNKAGGAHYTDEDLSTLHTLAAQAAIAIENARLFAQSDLIAEMVHELRTPLAAIKATTHILRRPEISEQKRDEMFDTVANETDRLARLTTEFLDLARLESGRARLNREDLPVAAMLREAMSTVEPQAEDANITLIEEFDADQLPIIRGDREKLKQVLLNLLTNAIKYNRPEGSVTVRARPIERGVEIAVADTGLGIAERDLPHIFDKFYRVADSEGYSQGTGLGLPVAKRVVEFHGGEIDVESEAGVGTTFRFTLPL